MAVTNAKILETLESLPNAIAESMATVLAQTQSSITPVDTTPSNNGGGSAVNTVNGEQLNLYTYFLPRGGKAFQVATAINRLEVGQSLKYNRGCHGKINQAWRRSSYGEPNKFPTNRIRVLTRRTSKTGKTVADGRVFHVHVPPGKLGYPKNQITVTRKS